MSHLTATCIDAAAGKPDFSPFPQWLGARLKADRLDEHTDALVQDLVLADSDTTVIKTLRKALATGQQPQTLTDEYYNEEGVTRTFKGVLHSLDPWLKEWLAESYFIVDKRIVIPGVEDEWLRLDTIEKFQRVVNYLFQEIRNVYTHTVEDRPSREHSMGSYRRAINGMKYRFKAIYDVEDMFVKDVGLREGLVESEVIQLLVVAYIRKCWLYMQDDESLLDAYRREMVYRRSRFHMLRELRSNLDLVERWCTADLLLPAYAIFDDGPLDKISTNWTRSFVELHESRDGGPLGLYVNVHAYLRCAERVNQRIDDFNESHDEHGRQETLAFVNEISQESDVAKLMWFLQDTVHHLVDEDLYY